MAGATTAVLIGAAVVGTGLQVKGAIDQRNQAKHAAAVAGETAEENRLRREAAVRQRTETLGHEKAFTEIERQRDIRRALNQARAAQAAQEAAGGQLGIRTGISAVATEFAGDIGFAQQQFAASQIITEGQRKQQDILTGLTPISEIPGVPERVTRPARIPGHAQPDMRTIAGAPVEVDSFGVTRVKRPATNDFDRTFGRPAPVVNTSVVRNS